MLSEGGFNPRLHHWPSLAERFDIRSEIEDTPRAHGNVAKCKWYNFLGTKRGIELKKSTLDKDGNVLKRESKMAKIAESFTMNAVDFVQANEEVMSRPEWKLRKKFPGVTTSGAYRPSKDMKIDGKPVSEDDKKKIAQLFMDINGQTVRENYDYLNSLDADEYKDALNKIRSYAIEKAKDEVVPTKARPKLHLKRKKKGADN